MPDLLPKNFDSAPLCIPQQQRPYPPLTQPVFGNTPQHFSQQYPDFTTHHVNQNYSQINRNHLEKWGFKFDGTNKSFTVEDFVFRVEVLKNDYNCPWDMVMNGFHHLVTGAASTWF
ncbi:hypothetical protein CVS40_9881 [Lucilia cuprina]|nr:hypothetical protein CVS40_9881 [Lucilia cuprina]